MESPLRVLVATLTLAIACGSAAPLMAGNAGQEDLDKATKTKLTARTVKDLEEVIRLCESARQKGLDKDNEAFAKQMLASTLIQRGLIVGKALADVGAVTPGWPKLREVALADLERGVKLDPEQTEALLYIARLNLLPGGNSKRAGEVLDQVIAGGSTAPELRAKALVLRSELQKDPKKRRADLDEAVRAAPRDPAVVMARGLFLADLGELEAALQDLKKAGELEPERAAPYEAQAIVLAKQKKYDEALVALDMARQREPDSTYPLMQQARVHTLQGNLNAALHDLDQAASRDPNDVEVLLLRGGVYQELGQKDKAAADVDRVLKLRPGYPGAVRMRTLILFSEGKMEQAIADMEKLRKSQPKDPATLAQLGMLYSAAQDYSKAIEIYTALLALETNNFLALRGRADALLGQGKHAEAIADYQRALKLDATDSGLLNNFAWVLATSPSDKVRDGKRALVLATDACKRTDYKQAHILSTLAAAYAETGDFKSARQWSEKAMSLCKPDQKQAMQKEVDSYRAEKPWREAKPVDDGPAKAKPADKQAAATDKKPTAVDKKPPADKKPKSEGSGKKAEGSAK